MGIVALAVSARIAGAQSAGPSHRADQNGDPADDTTRAAPAAHLPGRVRVGLTASAEHLDKSIADTYQVGAGISPFVGDHLQIGIAPAWRELRDQLNPAYQIAGSTIAARYVFGGDPHWRGYVGAFGGAWHAPHALDGTLLGAQVGALYFLTPALAVRAEIDARRGAYYFAEPPRFTELLITLDPYVFGTADDVAVVPVRLGTVDVAGEYVYERFHSVAESGISATVAPYLSRWTQVGADGEASGSSQGYTAHRLRGFGRLYLPLTLRTQPFVEGFAETTTYDETGGLTSYGGELGIRRMLNGNVALDIGLQRRMHPREQLGSASFRYWTREPGATSLVIGMMTRIGRAH